MNKTSKRWMPAVWVAATLLCLPYAAPAAKTAGLSTLRKSVYRISTPGHGSCTAVCISPAGHLLCIAHCRPTEKTVARLDGRRFGVTVVHNPPSSVFRRQDPPVVLKLKATGSVPYVPVASSAPEKGDRVFAVGFPSGQFAYHEGIIRDLVVQNGQKLLQTSFRVYEGHSGGPLFNASGELVGLASTRSPVPGERGYRGGPAAANWVHTSDIWLALRAARVSATAAKRRTLYVFSSKTCGSCQYVKRYEKQIRDSWRPHGDVVFLELGTNAFRETANRCREATGQAVKAVPTFWVEGTTVLEADYRKFGTVAGQFNVLAVVRWAVRAVAQFLVGRVKKRRSERINPPVPAVPKSQPEPTPIPDTQPDWSAVTVVVLIAKRNLGVARSLGARLSLKLAAGPIRRRVDRALGEKVALQIVAERQSPTRYQAVVDAASITVEKFALIVLIAKRPVGMFRGLQRRIAERILVSKLKDAAFDLVFERTHPKVFAEVRRALLIQEPRVLEPERGSSELGIAARIDALKAELSQKDRRGEESGSRQKWTLFNTGISGSAILLALLSLWRRRRKNVSASEEVN